MTKFFQQMQFLKEKKMLSVIIDTLPVLALSYTAQLLFKQGVNSIGGLSLGKLAADPLGFILKILLTWQIDLGFVLAGLGAIMYLIALSKNDFTVVFPILSAVGFIVLPVIAFIFLKENITTMRVVGTLVITVGMLIIAGSR